MSTVLCAIAIKHAYVWLHATTVKDVKRSSSPRTFLLKKVRYSSPFISKVGSNLGFFVFFFSLSLSFSLFAYIHICIVTIDHILPLYALLFFNGIMMPGSALWWSNPGSTCHPKNTDGYLMHINHEDTTIINAPLWIKRDNGKCPN
jgi:hypothetical protein